MSSKTATATTTPLIVADPTKGIKVNAGNIAKPFRDEIKAKVLALKEQGKGKWFIIYTRKKRLVFWLFFFFR